MAAVVSTMKPQSLYKDADMRGYHAILTIDGIEGYSEFMDKGGIDVVAFNFTTRYNDAHAGFRAPQGGQKPAAEGKQKAVMFDGLMIRKRIDKATPLLFQAMAKATKIKTVAIHLYRDPPEGGEAEHFYTITLGDVYVSLASITDLDFGEGEGKGAGQAFEDVRFIANSIEHNHVKAQKVASVLLTGT